jgi:hypothetical protein
MMSRRGSDGPISFKAPSALIRLVCAGVTALWLAASSPAAAQTDRQFSPAELRQDFDHLYSGLKQAHVDLYAFASRRELDAAFRRERARLNRPMSRAEAAVRFNLFTARVRMGHTRIEEVDEGWSAFQSNGGLILPVRIRVVEGRAFITADHSGSRSVEPGDELVSMDGLRASEWLVRTRRHIGAESAYMADSLLEFMFPRLVWRELGERASFDLVLRRSGRLLRVRLPARKASDVQEARSADRLRLVLTDERKARVLPGGIAYLRPGPFYEPYASTPAGMFDAAAFTAFIDRSFSDFLASEATDLLIDLRDNPGGDNSFSDPMIAWFATKPFRFASRFEVRVSPQSVAANAARLGPRPEEANAGTKAYAELYSRTPLGSRVKVEQPWMGPRAGRRFGGRVYVLQDRHSFSNAVLVSAIVQDFGFGVILGEETSDMATTYGAAEQFKLPETGLTVTFPKAFIVRPSGDTRSRGVVPDLRLPTPVLQSPSDEVLESALEEIRRGRPKS